jgi:hypothetical protein
MYIEKYCFSSGFKIQSKNSQINRLKMIADIITILISITGFIIRVEETLDFSCSIICPKYTVSIDMSKKIKNFHNIDIPANIQASSAENIFFTNMTSIFKKQAIKKLNAKK